MPTIIVDDNAAESLDISLEKLGFIILKARAFDVQVPAVDPDDGSNAVDDDSLSVIESEPGDPTGEELAGAIMALSEEEQRALVALTWIGRGDFEPSEWKAAMGQAYERRDMPTWRYLMGIPLLGDYLEEGAAAMGVNLTEYESTRDDQLAGQEGDEPAGDRIGDQGR